MSVLTFLCLATLSPFTLAHSNGKDWFLDPAGKQFWSFAVDCVDTGANPAKRDPSNPSYSGLQHYPNESAWAAGTSAQLRKWGFNSLGGWSDSDAMKGSGLPYFVVLHLGAYHRVPWDDLFGDPVRKAVWKAASTLVPKYRNDPNLVGFFTDNELGWWGDTLFISYLKMPANAPGKKRLMSEVRGLYPSFGVFQRDWITSAKSFDDLARPAKAWLRPGGRGMRLVNRWLYVLGTQYYSMVRSAVKAYDTKHLILGDRYPQFYELPIAQSSAKYIDVASTNMGASWNDGTLTPFFLDTLHRVTGKPVVITEFYMGAMENRSGNKNEPAAFPVVATQKERAAAFATNVRELASLPYVIGAHWFQFYDEPPKGRGDGENFNHGLVDIEGRPYDEMIAASADANPQSVHAAPLQADGTQSAPNTTPVGRIDLGPNSRPKMGSTLSPHPALSLGERVRIGVGNGNLAPLAQIPRAPAKPMTDLKNWSRPASWLPSNSALPFADLYACADQDAVYLGLIAMDYMDESLYQGGRVPEMERSTWTIRLAGHSPIIVRYGGHAKATVSDPSVRLAEFPGLQHTVTLRIPSRLRSVRLDGTLTTHSRAHRMSWKTTLRRSLSLRPNGKASTLAVSRP